MSASSFGFYWETKVRPFECYGYEKETLAMLTVPRVILSSADHDFNDYSDHKNQGLQCYIIKEFQGIENFGYILNGSQRIEILNALNPEAILDAITYWYDVYICRLAELTENSIGQSEKVEAEILLLELIHLEFMRAGLMHELDSVEDKDIPELLGRKRRRIANDTVKVTGNPLSYDFVKMIYRSRSNKRINAQTDPNFWSLGT